MLKSIYNQKSAKDLTRRFVSILVIVAILFAILPLDTLAAVSSDVHNVTEVDNFTAAYLANQVGEVNPAMDPGGVPHYFGPYPNYAYTPLPKGPVTDITVDNAGSGYKDPIVIIDDVYGTGTGAIATAATDPNTGAIINIDLTNGGKDYTAPIVTIKNAADPQGTGAIASATIGGDTGSLSGGIRKFVDQLPGLKSENANQIWAVHPGRRSGYDHVP